MILLKTLKALLLVSPKKDFRYHLNSLQITRNGNEVTFNAADGHMLLQVKTTNLNNIEIEDGVSLIICRKSLDTMIKFFKSSDSPVLKCDSDLNVTLGDLPLSKVEGNYPDVQRVITESSKRCDEIGVDYSKLSVISKACAMVADTKFTGGKMKVRGVTDSIRFERSFDDYSFIGLLMPARL